MLQVGEIISSIANAAKTFAAKFFPGNTDSVDLDQTASMLTRATEEHDNVLRLAGTWGRQGCLGHALGLVPGDKYAYGNGVHAEGR